MLVYSVNLKLWNSMKKDSSAEHKIETRLALNKNIR